MRFQNEYLVTLLLVILTGFVFAHVLSFDFINLDDPAYIIESGHVLSGLSTDNVVWAFTTNHLGNWHPLTWLSFMLDAQLFGDDASGFHFTNVLLHTMNAVLLFAALNRMTGECIKSGFVAALFAVHPLRVESVAWISERKDVLCTFFALLSLLAYIRYVRKPRTLWYVGALFGFAMSLMSKQMLVTLPFVFLLLDYWPLRRSQPANGLQRTPDSNSRTVATSDPSDLRNNANSRSYRWPQLIREKLPFFLLAALFCAIALVVQQNAGATGNLQQFSIPTRIMNALCSYMLYIGKTIWPLHLAVYYPHPGSELPRLEVGIAMTLLIGVSLVAIKCRHRWPFLIVGWFWYLGTLVPVIGIVQVGGQQWADRYSYIPSVGLFIAAVWLVSSLVPDGIVRSRVVPVVSAGILLLLASIARTQAEKWHDSITLFEHTLAVAEPSHVAHNNLGIAYSEVERFEESEHHLRRALEIDPSISVTHFNLANTLRALDKRDKAIDHYHAAIARDRRFAYAYNNLGLALFESQRYAQAISSYRQAISIDPKLAEAHINLANSLSTIQRYDEAIHHCRAALAIDSNLAHAYNNWGVALHHQHRFREAADAYRHAVDIDPDFAGGYSNLGSALVGLQRYQEAIVCYQRALDINPGFEAARRNLDLLNKRTSRKQEAGP